MILLVVLYNAFSLSRKLIRYELRNLTMHLIPPPHPPPPRKKLRVRVFLHYSFSKKCSQRKPDRLGVIHVRRQESMDFFSIVTEA